MDRQFQISDFVFRVKCPDTITPPPNFMLFETRDKIPEYTYEIKISKKFPEPETNPSALRPDLAVFQSEAGEMRLIGVKGTPGAYACYRELAPDCAEVILDPDRLTGLSIDPVFTSLFALERRLLEKDSLILHCAYTVYQDKAILFSAPSETGKTTQANLWEKYRGSRTINGDRAVLCRKNGIWYAQGWPVCGTSGVCRNEEFPIRVIVMLRQATENHAASLTGLQALRLVMEQVTINNWDTSFQLKAMDLLELLLQDIPLFLLECNISEDAVACLEKNL